ncbi:MAG: DUF2089 domain-containing protein [Tissierellia bacterium]|nr:DUF2089 domain-containing protein [Tissierellia bacterium]
MKKEVISACPVCSNDLVATKLSCLKCGTVVEGEFHFSKFQKLPKEELEFVEIFIKNRGNIKAIEKEMNISYPTVRNKLENVIELLGYKKEPVVAPDPAEVLGKLNSGEITAVQAIKILNNEDSL